MNGSRGSGQLGQQAGGLSARAFLDLYRTVLTLSFGESLLLFPQNPVVQLFRLAVDSTVSIVGVALLVWALGGWLLGRIVDGDTAADPTDDGPGRIVVALGRLVAGVPPYVLILVYVFLVGGSGLPLPATFEDGGFVAGALVAGVVLAVPLLGGSLARAARATAGGAWFDRYLRLLWVAGAVATLSAPFASGGAWRLLQQALVSGDPSVAMAFPAYLSVPFVVGAGVVAGWRASRPDRPLLAVEAATGSVPTSMDDLHLRIRRSRGVRIAGVVAVGVAVAGIVGLAATAGTQPRRPPVLTVLGAAGQVSVAVAVAGVVGLAAAVATSLGLQRLGPLPRRAGVAAVLTAGARLPLVLVGTLALLATYGEGSTWYGFTVTVGVLAGLVVGPLAGRAVDRRRRAETDLAPDDRRDAATLAVGAVGPLLSALAILTVALADMAIYGVLPGPLAESMALASPTASLAAATVLAVVLPSAALATLGAAIRRERG